ncbi:hypothetical protein [Algoriphagus chordae]|uniref:HEPN domain-containing protein n=1 Tax=Algoriphagus chordae TaxID=237019 RepID=A0A2W7RAD5_9BACT|nr:hypothetical protein [Algoriphagus chordae]PZX57933.1 hypothetical protein LV85_00116 [Algoriphagus chordae]
MSNSKKDLVNYRLARAHETFDDAQLLADNNKLFTWWQKGDYDDLFDFDRETVLAYLEKVKTLIAEVEKLIQ